MASEVRPLAGIRVMEMGIAIAGPAGLRFLAHFGAEVIKVDPPVALIQIGSGWLDQGDPRMRAVTGDTAPNENGIGKIGVTLDLKRPEGKEAAHRLLRTCDAFQTNFAPDAIRNLGFTYDDVRKVKPDIIYVSMHGFGARTGLPYSEYSAWGPNQLALAGADELTGHADGPPAISTVAANDYLSAFTGAFALLTALEHRDQTGEGQLVDVSQFQAAVTSMGAFLLDYELNGHVEQRDGNRLQWMAPNGAYRCRGEDEWVAISVFTDEQWRALGRVAGSPSWAKDRRFASVRGRVAHQPEIDRAIEAWTKEHTTEEVSAWLQAAGVAAHTAYDQAGVITDPQLGSREYWQFPPHYRFGPDLAMGLGMKFSDTPAHPNRGAPVGGEDTDYVLGEICGYSQAEIDHLVAEGVTRRIAEPELKLQRPYRAWAPAVLKNVRWPK